MAVDGPVGKMGDIDTPDLLPFELDRKVTVCDEIDRKYTRYNEKQTKNNIKSNRKIAERKRQN
jgi:hypothetical protein